MKTRRLTRHERVVLGQLSPERYAQIIVRAFAIAFVRDMRAQEQGRP